MIAVTGRVGSSGRRFRRRSPSVTMPASVPSSFTTMTLPKPLALISAIAACIVAPIATIGRRSPVCMTSRTSLSCAPSLPPGWKTPKVPRREAPPLEQRDGERVAERELHGRRGRRREPVRAGLLGFRDGKADVRLPAEGRGGFRGHADDRDAEALGIGDEVRELGRLAGPGQRQDGVVRVDHAEVAVARLAGVDVVGGRAGRSEGGRHLAGDVARLAHAGDDDPALRRRDELDGGDEALAEPVLDGAHEHLEPVALGRERPERRGDGWRGLGRFSVRHGHGVL